MPSVDNRVVEMRFDNKDFETGVSESISSLDKLKSSLKFKDEVEGLDEIDKAADSINKKFSVLGTISDQLFRNLANEIYNLKTQFVGMVKSLSTDQIAEGWDKYAVKTQAVQTIMAATASQIEDEGERMEYVNEQLDKLNWFADETSASLMDMTNNIGKFTNNGVKLDDAVTAMQGIANWGYLSGANINDMSRAMYNLSQALSVGAVTLIDWKSIENANMATVEFKQTALDTAVAVGTLTKVSDGLYKTLEGNEVTLTSFNQYLTKDKWFNKEVLQKTLDKYGDFTNELSAEMDKIEAHQGSVSTSKFLEYIDKYLKGQLDINEAVKRTGIEAEELIEDLKRLGGAEFELGRKAFKAAQEAKTFTEAIEATKDAVSSKWLQTFEIIFGDYQQAKDLWTKLSNELWDIFAAGGEARNDMLRKWADDESGGYKVFWDSVWNIWEGLKGLGGRIKSAWKAIFPGLDSQKLIDFTKKLYDFSVKFRDRFAEVEESVEAVAETVGNAVTGAKDFVRGLIKDKAPGEAVEEIGELNDAIDDHIVRLAKTIMAMDALVALVNGGKYSVNPERRKMLEEEGYSFELIQNAINELYGSNYRYAISEEDMAAAMELINQGLIDEEGNILDVAKATEEATDEVIEARTWIDDLRDVLGGLKSAFDLLIEGGKLAVKYLVVPAWNFLVKVFKKVLAVIAPFSSAFSDFVARLKESKAITKTIEMIVEWFRMLGEKLKEHENIKTFIGYFNELRESVDGLKQSALDRVNEFFDKIVHLDQNIKLPKVGDVADWIDGVVGHINDGIESLRNFEGFWPKIQAFFAGLDFSSATNFGKTAGEGISEFFKTLFQDKDLNDTGKKFFDGIWAGFVEKIKTVDWGEVIGIVAKAVGTSVLVRLGWSIATFFNSFKNIGRGTLGLFESVGKVLQSFSKTLNATAFLEVAIGIGILAAAMFALTKVDQENLANVAVDMAAVILALSVLMSVFGKAKIFGDKTKLKNVGRITNSLTINLPKLGITLIGLALAIGSIVLACKVLSKIPVDKMKQVFLFLVAILGTFTILAIVIDKLELSGRKMIAMAGAFAIVALAFNLLIPAIASLVAMASALVIGQMERVLLYAIGTIVAIMLAFGGMAGIARNAQNVILTATAFLIFSAAILVLTPALIALTTAVSGKPWWSMVVVVGSIVALLAALTGAMVLLNYSAGKSKNMDKAIKAMLTMAAGVVAIGAVLYVLKGAQWDDLKGTVGAILLVLGGLTAIAVILGATLGSNPLIAKGILAIAAAIALIGAGVALAGVGILAFAKALQILSDSSVDAKKTGKNLAEGITAFFDELVENGESIIIFIGMVLSAVVGALIAFKSPIVDQGAQILTALGDKVIEIINSKSFGIAVAVLTLIGTLLYVLGLSAPDVADFLGYTLANIINSLAIAVRDTSGYIFKAIMNLGSAVINSLFEGMGNALAARAEQGDILAKIIQLFSNEGLNNIHQGIFGSSNAGRITKMIAAITGVDTDTIDIINKSPFVILGDALSGATKKTADTLEESQEEIEGKMDASWTKMTEKWRTFSLFGQKSQEAGEAYQDGVSSMVDSIMTANKKVDINGVTIKGDRLKQLQEGLLNATIKPEDIATYIPEAFQEGAKQAETELSGSGLFDNIGSWLMNELGEKTGISTTMYENGADGASNLLSGFANGLTEGEQDYLDAFSMFTDGTYGDYTKFWDMNSPSKVTEELGGYLVEGFAIGIEKGSSRSLNATNKIFESMISLIRAKALEIKKTMYVVFNESFNAKALFKETEEQILDAFNSVVARISDAINGDFDMSPVIRPVLDLSEIQNGSARIGSILGTNAYMFNPNLSYGMIGANNVVAAAGQMSLRDSSLDESLMMLRMNMNQINNDNKTIINTLGRYLPYIPEFANMQVTLDKKTLVGQLTPAINAKLGDIALAKR